MRATQMSESDMGKHIPSWNDKREEWQFVAQKLEQGHTLARINYQTILFLQWRWLAPTNPLA